VVGLALWPETLTGWALAQRLKTSAVWATLAGAPSDPVRDLLARRLGVSLRELAVLIDGRRRTPAAQQAWAVDPAAHEALLSEALAAADALPDLPPRVAPAGPPEGGPPNGPAAAPAPSTPRRRGAGAPRRPPGDDQIALGL
jgi:hypothetical protein